MARWSALAEENDLDVLIRPYYPLYYRPHWTSGSVGRYRGNKATSIASGVLGMMVQIIPLAFLGTGILGSVPRTLRITLRYMVLEPNDNTILSGD